MLIPILILILILTLMLIPILILILMQTLILTLHPCLSFRQECLHKLSEEIFIKFSQLFSVFPLAVHIPGYAFIVHGGLPRHPGLGYGDINAIDRVSYLTTQDDLTGEPSEKEWELLLDILWSDPNEKINGTQPSARGCSVEFGPDMVRDFLKRLPTGGSERRGSGYVHGRGSTRELSVAMITKPLENYP